ncbi:MAG: bifunctional folylpolyglutamate synthase/dihydrofolate synthase [Flavobacteriaceae bacterium]|nr:bifunctional folylpolyglutamate synthase/dihydrofolate synthase [Flavobacteriaceae bacterium]
MNYKETLDWMFTKLPMYQRQGTIAFKKDLTNILSLSKQLGFPEKKFTSIHVAGTNGKGSTSHMLASVIQESSYKVGLYTSPHLKDFRERIKVNGVSISEQNVIDFIKKNNTFLEQQKLSFFEMTVGMAFEFFANQKVDIAIIEVGLGGRLDSTNIITPLVSVITNIGLDHTQFLGETLPEIAFEKAGIIKPNIPVVIGEKQENIVSVFKKIASKNNAPIYFAYELVSNKYTSDLLGDYQIKNIKTTVQTLHLLAEKKFNISDKEIRNGLKNIVKNTGLKGRWQVLNKHPKAVCDTAHNKEGLTIVMNQLKNEKYQNLHIILGVVNDKNLDSLLSLFPKNASYYFCKPNIPRGLNTEILKQEASKFELYGKVFDSVNQAYQKALSLANNNDFIYIGGSTFVVAELPL